MILVTGAAGKTGRSVIRALKAQRVRVRGLIRRREVEIEVDELVVGDMRVRADLDKAMQGVRGVYHICPNMSPDELAIGKMTIAAAKSAGVEHFVYHSVLHPQVEAMPHHWQKMQVEALLFESGIAYTILQPAAYMQNILAHRKRILTQGVYPVPYRVGARLSLVDLEDVGAAAATVLTQPGHYGAIYELAGTAPLTQTTVADILSRALGHPVYAERVPLTQWKQDAQKVGLGDYQIDTLVKMFQYYDRYGLEGNPNVLTWLLGRPPHSLTDFAQRVF